MYTSSLDKRPVDITLGLNIVSLDKLDIQGFVAETGESITTGAVMQGGEQIILQAWLPQ